MDTCSAINSEGNSCVRDTGHEGRHLRIAPAGHLCHAIGCHTPVPPKMLMCLKHWRMVPRDLQQQVWATYRPGQEDDKNPSEAYMVAQERAVNAVRTKERRQ